MPYKRKTEDEWYIEGYYFRSWEDIASYSTRKEAKDGLKDYRANDPHSFRLRKRRVPIYGPQSNPGSGNYTRKQWTKETGNTKINL